MPGWPADRPGWSATRAPSTGGSPRPSPWRSSCSPAWPRCGCSSPSSAARWGALAPLGALPDHGAHPAGVHLVGGDAPPARHPARVLRRGRCLGALPARTGRLRWALVAYAGVAARLSSSTSRRWSCCPVLAYLALAYFAEGLAAAAGARRAAPLLAGGRGRPPGGRCLRRLLHCPPSSQPDRAPEPAHRRAGPRDASLGEHPPDRSARWARGAGPERVQPTSLRRTRRRGRSTCAWVVVAVVVVYGVLRRHAHLAGVGAARCSACDGLRAAAHHPRRDVRSRRWHASTASSPTWRPFSPSPSGWRSWRCRAPSQTQPGARPAPARSCGRHPGRVVALARGRLRRRAGQPDAVRHAPGTAPSPARRTCATSTRARGARRGRPGRRAGPGGGRRRR